MKEAIGHKVTTILRKLIWVPPATTKGQDIPPRVPPVSYKGRKPDRLWTLFQYTDPDKRPDLSNFEPQHRINAFIEDRVHDWDIRNGELRYYSRVTDGGVWVLLEFDSKAEIYPGADSGKHASN